MKLKLYFLPFLLLLSFELFAYTSPGTNQKLTLENLVTLSGGEVTFINDTYNVNAVITISATDTLSITSNATVKFAAATNFQINGVLIINPPTGVLFTAQNTGAAYNGVALSFSNASLIRKLTFEYAVSFKLSDSSPTLDSCIFQFNNNSSSTTFGNGALSLFRAHPIVTNCQFINNNRAAIQGGANITNTPKIFNCLFKNNNTGTTSSLPQINMGAAGLVSDTCKIINCRFEQASIYSGAIGFLPIGDVYALITGNTIRKNRYGITFNGGSNIHARVAYNIIDSNRIQNDPLLGGSGIAFSGGSSSSHQSVIVTGNIIRWNLWGITVGPTSTGGGAMPNLGNLTNTDTSDNGKNQFINNNNTSSTPQIDFYNNNADDVFAQGNYWGTNDPSEVEAKIFHKTDNAALGLVNYSSFLVPIELLSFSAKASGNKINLEWKTATEVNSDHFEIEESADGQYFTKIAQLNAAGNSNSDKSYLYIDADIAFYNKPLYYRLKLVDKDGKFKYSDVVSVKIVNKRSTDILSVYPNLITSENFLRLKILSDRTQSININFIDASGKLLSAKNILLNVGTSNYDIPLDVTLPSGVIMLQFVGKDFKETRSIIKQ